MIYQQVRPCLGVIDSPVQIDILIGIIVDAHAHRFLGHSHLLVIVNSSRVRRFEVTSHHVPLEMMDPSGREIDLGSLLQFQYSSEWLAFYDRRLTSDTSRLDESDLIG